MPDGYLDNPAGRLFALFEEAKKQAPNDAAVNGWFTAFGYTDSGGDSTSAKARQVLRDGIAVMDQVAEVRRLVEELPDDPDIYLEHFPEVEGTANNFGALLSHSMANFMQPYSPTARQCLRMCSSLLHKHRPEPTIKEDDRQDLLAKVEKLQDAIVADDGLPDDVKKFVTRDCRRCSMPSLTTR